MLSTPRIVADALTPVPTPSLLDKVPASDLVVAVTVVFPGAMQQRRPSTTIRLRSAWAVRRSSSTAVGVPRDEIMRSSTKVSK